MSAIAATVGLFLLAPAWIPGLALSLVALWWGGRALPSRLRRAAAVEVSPLVAAFFFTGGIQWMSFQLAALAGAIVYGCVVKLPGHSTSASPSRNATTYPAAMLTTREGSGGRPSEGGGRFLGRASSGGG
jgi:hypothetical protein